MGLLTANDTQTIKVADRMIRELLAFAIVRGNVARYLSIAHGF